MHSVPRPSLPPPKRPPHSHALAVGRHGLHLYLPHVAVLGVGALLPHLALRPLPQRRGVGFLQLRLALLEAGKALGTPPGGVGVRIMVQARMWSLCAGVRSREGSRVANGWGMVCVGRVNVV